MAARWKIMHMNEHDQNDEKKNMNNTKIIKIIRHSATEKKHIWKLKCEKNVYNICKVCNLCVLWKMKNSEHEKKPLNYFRLYNILFAQGFSMIVVLSSFSLRYNASWIVMKIAATMSIVFWLSKQRVLAYFCPLIFFFRSFVCFSGINMTRNCPGIKTLSMKTSSTLCRLVVISSICVKLTVICRMFCM